MAALASIFLTTTLPVIVCALYVISCFKKAEKGRGGAQE